MLIVHDFLFWKIKQSNVLSLLMLYSREYHWANYATGLGAALHELGHTFDLAHTPTGVMARGFDDINRVFIVQRYKSKQQWQRDRDTSEDRSIASSIESCNEATLTGVYTPNAVPCLNPVQKVGGLSYDNVNQMLLGTLVSR